MVASSRRSRRFRAIAVTVAVAAVTGGGLLPMGTAPAAAAETFRPQLVTVDTPTRADKDRLVALGLDLTEHAGHDYVEVVLHHAGDALTLRAAGLDWQVRIPDLVRRASDVNAANRAYAAATTASPLPSGRDSYRTLSDYNADLDRLAAGHPGLVRKFALPYKSLEGKQVYGVEIADHVDAVDDGRPVFVMLGLHHAREWPSGEHAVEFAYDLAENHGHDARITDLLRKARVIVVPVVNVDGFEKSVNDGQLVDLRTVDEGGTGSILATPGNAYKRKNCRIIDGLSPLAGECGLVSSPGGFGAGIDLNRNYGGFWGGPGAAAEPVQATYRGAAPFSEPETRNIRALVSGRQVTGLITNHTFSNLVLRPNGVAPDTIGQDGLPVGDPPDEVALKELGDRMAAQNGYTSQHSWELYDTTGTTEDWSYNATGGYGYTFEIGPDEFHPPFPEVVDEYLGAGAYAGKGNREAFLLALENAVDPRAHSVLTGKAPAGATLRLKKTFATPTWAGVVQDTLDTTLTVGAAGSYTWHVNPSTRPVVQARQTRVISSEPLKRQSYTGTTAPTLATDQEFTVDRAADLLEVKLDWPTPDDLDLRVLRKNTDGTLTEVGSSAGSVGVKERVLLDSPAQGTYVLRVENWASATPSWTLTASLYDATEQQTGGLVENWTLSCEKNGTVLERVPVVVDRGGRVKADLKTCAKKWSNG
ncbi:carboxypeptidase [Streptomyces sp. ISL-36]|uniref:M14 family zinc carboxypeptidase n=1 Tax=Streptomyces sp. ISL-36 TaxID=2819182 RepID=UPI001BE625E6|nr:M14 family zinc carboxypeptidase [Streptomyces sp. ISL-36]MBT2440765.1 carboxypeptidase [Streptomyces sp. ISL-36]